MMFDKYGMEKAMLLDEDVAEYKKREQCFVRQYSRYFYFRKKIDGKKTLERNLMDNSALRVSFRAYRKFLKKHGPEKKLPGLEKYSSEQLFFLAYANVRCQTVHDEYAERQLLQSYSPNNIVISGTLSNFQEFAATWRCTKDSPMNPNDKCILW